jgi:hypothetical protein
MFALCDPRGPSCGLVASSIATLIEPQGAISAERRAALADLEERRKRREAAEREGTPAQEQAE